MVMILPFANSGYWARVVPNKPLHLLKTNAESTG